MEAIVENSNQTKRHQRSWIARTTATYRKLTTPDPTYRNIENQIEKLNENEIQLNEQNEATIPAPWQTVPTPLSYNKSLPTKSATTADTTKKLTGKSIQPLGRLVFYIEGSVHKRQAGGGIGHNQSTTVVIFFCNLAYLVERSFHVRSPNA